MITNHLRKHELVNELVRRADIDCLTRLWGSTAQPTQVSVYPLNEYNVQFYFPSTQGSPNPYYNDWSPNEDLLYAFPYIWDSGALGFRIRLRDDQEVDFKLYYGLNPITYVQFRTLLMETNPYHEYMFERWYRGLLVGPDVKRVETLLKSFTRADRRSIR